MVVVTSSIMFGSPCEPECLHYVNASDWKNVFMGLPGLDVRSATELCLGYDSLDVAPVPDVWTACESSVDISTTWHDGECSMVVFLPVFALELHAMELDADAPELGECF